MHVSVSFGIVPPVAAAGVVCPADSRREVVGAGARACHTAASRACGRVSATAMSPMKTLSECSRSVSATFSSEYSSVSRNLMVVSRTGAS